MIYFKLTRGNFSSIIVYFFRTSTINI